MHLRRTRCLLLILIVFIIHIIIISLFNLNSSFEKYIIHNLSNFNILNIRKLLSSTTNENSADFDKLLLSNIDKSHLSTHFNNDNSKFITIDIPNRESFNNYYQPFDPRFTFGLLLKYINKHGLETDLPSFHWGDYTDMSVLEPYIFNPEKVKCNEFDVRRKNNGNRNRLEDLKDPSQFCINDFDLNNLSNDQKNDIDLDIVEKLSKNKEYSTGFHIYSWTGRGKKVLRPVLARSYLMDFMPLPLTLTFLIPNDKVLQINIQNDRAKLIDSPLFKTGEINIEKELELLSSKIQSKPIDLNYVNHLKQDDFIDTSEEIITQLSSVKLNQTDLNYLNSLKLSISNTNPPKYFHEANIIKKERNYGIGGHYDWRFMNGIMNSTPKQPISIHGLLKAWLKLTNSYKLNTWVAHGSLLSWYWNGLQFPWDGDVDVQMPIDHLHKLSRLFNQTVVVDFGNFNQVKFGRYFLDCSTYISQRSRGNGNNNIDARFIDLDTGLYIDITGLAISETKAPSRYNELTKNTIFDLRKSKDQTISQTQRNSFMQVYNCRNNHFSNLNELSPLRLTMVEGEFGYIPSEFEQALAVEYGDKSLKENNFKNYVFLPALRMWVLKNSITNFVKESKQLDSKESIIAVDLNDNEYIQYLKSDQSNLIEYLKVTNLTLFHQEEIMNYFEGKSTNVLFYTNEGKLDDHRMILRDDYFKHTKFDSEYDFKKELDKIKSKQDEYLKNIKARNELVKNDPVNIDEIPILKEPKDEAEVILDPKTGLPKLLQQKNQNS